MSNRHQEHLAGYLKSHRGRSCSSARGGNQQAAGSAKRVDVSAKSSDSRTKKDAPVLFTSNVRQRGAGVKTRRQVPARYTQVRVNGKGNINHLPDELLLKIFSYLDAGDLLTTARVCKRWNPVASDNLLWNQIFEKYCHVARLQPGAERPDQNTYKALCIKDCTQRRNKLCRKYLWKINPFTGLSKHSKDTLKAAGVYFQLCLTDSGNNELLYNSRNVFHHHMSHCVRWCELQMPNLATVKSIRVFSINPLFFEDNGTALPNCPYQKSMLYHIDLDWRKWLRTHPATGVDDMLKIHTLPEGLAIATWNSGKEGELAFISLGLHCNQILNRCLRGSATRIYNTFTHMVTPDDIDSTYGLHDYQCTVDIRTHGTSIWSQQFKYLACKTESIGCGYATFPLIRKEHRCDHVIFKKALNMPWKTETFRGVLKDVVWLDITVLDERGEPFWCVSSLCKISRQKITNNLDFDYSMEDTHNLCFVDSRCKLEAQMSLDDHSSMYFMTGLDLKLSLDAINTWFDTNYT